MVSCAYVGLVGVLFGEYEFVFECWFEDGDVCFVVSVEDCVCCSVCVMVWDAECLGDSFCPCARLVLVPWCGSPLSLQLG